MAFETKVPLKGTEKSPHAEATVVGGSDPREIARVTVVSKPDADVDSIVEFMRSSGLNVFVEHDVIKAEGSIGDLSQAFGTSLNLARLPNGRHFRQRVGSIMVPEELKDDIIAVLGLDNRPVASPRFHVHPNPELAKPLTPAQVAAAYGVPSSPVNGSQQCVGIISLGGGYSKSDLQAMGVDPSRVTDVSVDGSTNNPDGDPNGADGENTLDLGVSLPADTLLNAKFFSAPNSDNGFYDGIAAAIHDPAVTVISISWGSPESNYTSASAQAYATLAASSTKPIFVAAGDGGADDGTGAPIADLPASLPGCIGVGGTELQLNPYNETVWNDSGGGATGGGYSKIFSRPSWQPSSIGTKRGVPDVAANAAPSTGYSLVIGGHSGMVFGGTSAAAPMCAALYSITARSVAGQLSEFNQAIYGSGPSGSFNDITVGNNRGYSAAKGWDPCTGLGSFNVGKLVGALSGSSPNPNPPDPNPNPPNPNPPSPNPPQPSNCAQQVDADFNLMYAALSSAKQSDPTDISWYNDGSIWLKYAQQVLDGTFSGNQSMPRPPRRHRGKA